LDTQHITSAYESWSSGTKGFLLAYVLVAAFSLFGLKRGRATAQQYLFWPLSSLVTLVVVGVLLAIMQAILQSVFKTPPTAVLEVLVSALFMVFGGFGGGLYWASRSGRNKALHARGAVVMETAQSQRHARGLETQARRSTVESLTLVGIPVPFEDETKHFKFVGTTGSGKSTAMRELLEGALKRGDRAVIADPDGSFLSRFYSPSRGDVILNPFDARSAKWDLFAELKNPYDIEQMARALIPDRANADPTWTNYGRTFFGAIVRQAQACDADMGELYRLLTAAKSEELRVLVDGTAAAPFLEAGNEKFFGSVHSTVADHVRCLEYVCAQRAASFSVRDWIKSGRGVLFLPYQADQIAALRSIISTWMRLAIFQTLSLGEGDSRLWFGVDELDALGPIDGLSDALPRLRKVGGRCALGLQSISQMSTTYGQGLAQAMVENCGTTLALRCSASENGGTSRFVSRLIGEREVLRVVKSTSRSRHGLLRPSTSTQGSSEQHATEFAVMPAEIEQLPDRSGFLKFPSQPAWMRVSFPYYDVPKIAEPFSPWS
jgi:type IV secretory pathway TraG/TraD family ATPase VirD4